MARLARLSPVGIPQHIIQRGNNRQACFCCDQDFIAYAGWLKEYARKHYVDIHAWVLMTNHVHLLVTPQTEEGVSKLMQSLGRMYVRYFNREYKRTGTLWEGRFKSCLVQSEDYLLQCYRYIKLNPVRAGMVEDPAEYIWSSYQCNALGKQSTLIKPHDEYLRLGKDVAEREENYRELFKYHVDGQLIKDLREATNKGMALGSERFKEEIEFNYKRRVKPARMGRPKMTKRIQDN